MAKTIKIIVLSVSLIFGLAILALKRENSKNRIDHFFTVENNLNDDLIFKSVKIGSSNMSIKLPWELKLKTANLPQSITDNLSKVESFEFSRDKSFSGGVIYYVWKTGVEYSVEKGSDGAIEQMKALPGVEKIVDNREYFKNNNIDGCLTDMVIYRYGKSFQVKNMLLYSGRETWGITISFLEHKDENIADKIINSLR